MEIEFTKQPYIEDVGPLKMYVVLSVFLLKFNHSIDIIFPKYAPFSSWIILIVHKVRFFLLVYMFFPSSQIWIFGCLNSYVN